MHNYKIFDITFKSNFKLPALAESDTSDFKFEVSEVNITPKTGDIVWYLKIPYQNSALGTFAQLGKDKNYFLIKFNGYLDFFISKNLQNIIFSNKNGVDSTTIQHFLIDQVIPRLVSNNNNIVVHASAVEYKNNIVAFIGDSGSGKSTSVLALTNNSKKIHLLCDDSVLIENREDKFLTHPSYPAIRLWPNSAKIFGNDLFQHQKASEINNKLLISRNNPNSGFITEPKQLKSVYMLNPTNNNNVTIEEMTSQKAFEEITKGVFRLDVYDKNQLKEEFNFVSQLTKNIKFFGINYKQDFNLIDEFTEKITKHIEDNI